MDCNRSIPFRHAPEVPLGSRIANDPWVRTFGDGVDERGIPRRLWGNGLFRRLSQRLFRHQSGENRDRAGQDGSHDWCCWAYRVEFTPTSSFEMWNSSSAF